MADPKPHDSDEEEEENAGMPVLAKTVGKTRFAKAQRRIKRGLNLIHKVDAETYAALGRCLDEAALSVVQCWADFAKPPKDDDKGSEPQILTGHLAMTGVLSLVPPGHYHAELQRYLNETLDKFWGIECEAE
jgi:hypothetical protein